MVLLCLPGLKMKFARRLLLPRCLYILLNAMLNTVFILTDILAWNFVLKEKKSLSKDEFTLFPEKNSYENLFTLRRKFYLRTHATFHRS